MRMVFGRSGRLRLLVVHRTVGRRDTAVRVGLLATHLRRPERRAKRMQAQN